MCNLGRPFRTCRTLGLTLISLAHGRRHPFGARTGRARFASDSWTPCGASSCRGPSGRCIHSRALGRCAPIALGCAKGTSQNAHRKRLCALKDNSYVQFGTSLLHISVAWEGSSAIMGRLLARAAQWKKFCCSRQPVPARVQSRKRPAEVVRDMTLSASALVCGGRFHARPVKRFGRTLEQHEGGVTAYAERTESRDAREHQG